jgi:mycothiol synthase
VTTQRSIATETVFANTDEALVELRDLIADCYAANGEFPNWSGTLLQHWYYSCRARRVREEPDWWSENCRVWRDESGRAVGFCAPESGGDPVLVVSHPDNRWVEVPILEWLVANRLPKTGRVTVGARTSDELRQGFLRATGFVEREECEREYLWDLAEMNLDNQVPAGFVVKGMSADEDFTKQATITRTVFPRSEYDRESHDSLRRAPDYSAEFDVAVVAPSGEHVAIACAMLDRRNGVADFEPVGTHPDYRGRGLARAAVFEAFRRLRASGASRARISTGGEPYSANRFYRALGPHRIGASNAWVIEAAK